MGISSALGSSALLPAGLGFRNAIINGNFDIWQRGGTGGYTPTAGLIQGADRWIQWWNSATGTRTVSRSLFPLGQTAVPDNPKHHLTINTSVLGTGQTVHDIWQKIENVNTFAGQTVTLSFWWKSTNATIQATPFVSQNFGTGGSPSGTVDLFVQTQSLVSANVWTKYSASFVVPSISGKTLGTSNDHLMLGLRFVIGVACTIDVANVQLEANYQPTPFEQRPIGVELALCQRYYEKSYAQSVVPGTNQSAFPAVINVPFTTSFGQTDGWGCGRTHFKVVKRASPAVNVYNSDGTLNQLTTMVGTTAANVSNPGIYANDQGFTPNIGNHTAGVAVKVIFHYVASAEL